MALQVDRSLTQCQALGETEEVLDGRKNLTAVQCSARLEQKRVGSSVSKTASMTVLVTTVCCFRQDATTAAAVVNYGLGMARTARECDLDDLQMAHVSQSP